jgi:hypothetical protein
MKPLGINARWNGDDVDVSPVSDEMAKPSVVQKLKRTHGDRDDYHRNANCFEKPLHIQSSTTFGSIAVVSLRIRKFLENGRIAEWQTFGTGKGE